MLERVLDLLGSAPDEPDVGRGYLDLIGDRRSHDTVVQRLMRSEWLPRIYERVWRPMLIGLAKGGPFGPSTTQEYSLARDWLGLGDVRAATVLDVACGPGNVTRALASGMTGDGLVVGVDASATMLDRAVADTPPESTADIAYVRCDAVDLPFREDTFDAVSCFGGLYLFDDPWSAVAGMARVLRPGGRIVLLTSRRPGLPLVGNGFAALGRVTGIRMFAATELTEALAACGFSAIRRRSYGLMQFAVATLTDPSRTPA